VELAAGGKQIVYANHLTLKIRTQNTFMKIFWDEPKRLANLDKHGLDFRD
jgi:hypothetical protein